MVRTPDRARRFFEHEQSVRECIASLRHEQDGLAERFENCYVSVREQAASVVPGLRNSGRIGGVYAWLVERRVSLWERAAEQFYRDGSVRLSPSLLVSRFGLYAMDL